MKLAKYLKLSHELAAQDQPIRTPYLNIAVVGKELVQHRAPWCPKWRTKSGKKAKDAMGCMESIVVNDLDEAYSALAHAWGTKAIINEMGVGRVVFCHEPEPVVEYSDLWSQLGTDLAWYQLQLAAMKQVLQIDDLEDLEDSDQVIDYPTAHGLGVAIIWKATISGNGAHYLQQVLKEKAHTLEQDGPNFTLVLIAGVQWMVTVTKTCPSDSLTDIKLSILATAVTV